VYSLVPQVKAVFLKLLTAVASLACTLLVCEIVLRCLPVAWAPLVEPPTAAHPIQRYTPNTRFTWSRGWTFDGVVRGRSNAQGFLADVDYDAAATTPLVAVVGDSYIEALRVPFADTVTGRLQAMLGRHGRAYAFAQSGVPLSQYVAYARHACEVYRPERLVVTVVGNDFDESLYAHRQRDGIFHLYPRPDGSFELRLTPLAAPGFGTRILRHSALALYLARNVGEPNAVDWFRPEPADAPGGYVGQTAAAADPVRLDEGRRVIAWFLDALPQAACLQTPDIVLVVDAARPELYDPVSLAETRTSYFGAMRARLMSDARARGFKVVDLEPAFLAAHAADGRPFEWPNDAHWNAHGHAVAAAAVREALAGWPAPRFESP
jgi:hypothetical protein